MRKVLVTVNKDGTTTTDFEGFEGPACLAEADKLREILARLGVTSEQTNFIPKPELSAAQDSTPTRSQTQQEG